MPELFVETGPLKDTHRTVADSEAFVVGSDPSCNLQLNGPGVAARHLVIKALKNGGFGVKKLEGGFLLNGRETEAGRLRAGNTLDVGATRLRFGTAPNPKEHDAKERDARKHHSKGTPPKQDNGTLGGFRLFEVLGKGGMGTVYRAEQVSLHREVALKVLKKELTKDPVFVARFVAEAHAAARLSHPNVVQVIDVGHDGDTYFLSMELMHASSLEQRLRSVGTIPVVEAVQMVAGAAEGLAYAESLRIVHCDIKPDNLMLDQHGTVKIADLGLAMTDEDNLTKLVGTPHFMSPEQVRRQPMDHRSDLYALGCTFYRLLTGKTPFRGATVKDILRAQLKEDPQPPSKVNPEVPGAVDDIVLKLLQKEPGDRYQSANELLEDLHHVLSPPARKGLMIAGAAALVLLATGAIWWAATQDPIIIHENGTAKPDPEMQRRLRESNAESAYLKVLIDRSLTPTQTVQRLREVAKDHSGTKAAVAAIKIADGFEAEEKKKAAEIAKLKQTVDRALKSLRARLDPLFAKGDFRAISAALRNPKVDKNVSAIPEVKQALRGLRDDFHKQAGQKLTRLRAATDAALKNKDPDAVLASLPPLEAVLDKHKGWPPEVLPNRRGLVQFIRDAKTEANTLQTQLALEARRVAWQTFAAACNGKDGILTRVQRFDLDGAEALARKTVEQLQGQPPGQRMRRLLEIVQAAKRYLDHYQKAIATGAVYVPMNQGGPKMKVTGLTPGPNGKLTFELMDQDHKVSKEQPLALITGERLFEVFHDTTAHELTHERAALLALHMIVEHTAEAQLYLGRLSATDDASGTGKQAYHRNSMRLRELRNAMGKPKHGWESYLAEELRALCLMVDGFRALSERRNQAAATHTSRLLTKHQKSLVMMMLPN